MHHACTQNYIRAQNVDFSCTRKSRQNARAFLLVLSWPGILYSTVAYLRATSLLSASDIMQNEPRFTSHSAIVFICGRLLSAASYFVSDMRERSNLLCVAGFVLFNFRLVQLSAGHSTHSRVARKIFAVVRRFHARNRLSRDE